MEDEGGSLCVWGTGGGQREPHESVESLVSVLSAPIVLRPTRRMTQGELEAYLDKAADILRGNADHSEFRGYVFALLF